MVMLTTLTTEICCHFVIWTDQAKKQKQTKKEPVHSEESGHRAIKHFARPVLGAFLNV